MNEAFGFDPSAEQANVARTMQQAMLLMNNKQIQAQVNADPASGTMLAKLLAAEKDDEAAITRLYGKVLARKPTTQEIVARLRPPQSRRQPQRRLRRFALGHDQLGGVLVQAMIGKSMASITCRPSLSKRRFPVT